MVMWVQDYFISFVIFPHKINCKTGEVAITGGRNIENELMTPTISHGSNPLSRVSVASLLDLGYLVTFASAGSYVLPGPVALAAAPGATIRMVDDVARGPIFAVDRTGRVTRVIRR